MLGMCDPPAAACLSVCEVEGMCEGSEVEVISDRRSEDEAV